MKQPPNFVAQEELGTICWQRKTLYGLKQNSRAWFGKLGEVVQKFGKQKSKCNHSVFYKNSDASLILLVVYVDDIVITRSDSVGILSGFSSNSISNQGFEPVKVFSWHWNFKEGIFLS